MMQAFITIFGLIFCITSCQRKSEQQSFHTSKHERLFSLHDTLQKKYNFLPVDFNTLYVLSKQVITLADNYHKKDTLALSEIYRKSAEILRLHCDCEGSNALVCCGDSALIIECYKKAINVHHANSDTLSSGFTDALFQLAVVYEQLGQPFLSLPLRQEYLATSEKTKGLFSEMTSDAYMFLGSTYERLKDYELANDMYLRELKISKVLYSADLGMKKERIENFQKRYNSQQKN